MGFLGNLQQKSRGNYENVFSKIDHKMSMGRVPTEKFGVAECVYQKFVKINFRGRGPQKSKILGLFSKMGVRNFWKLGQDKNRRFWVLKIRHISAVS